MFRWPQNGRSKGTESSNHDNRLYIENKNSNKYLLLTEFEARTGSYGPSFFPFDLWPKREARGP